MENFVPFDVIDISLLRHDPRFDFMFPNAEIEQYYLNLLKSFCPVCGEEKKSLSALNRHTTMEHQLSYCDLCIRYSRLLPCEFVLMKPADLIKHRTWNKERKKGHPLCDFCEERFYEMEDLVNHIRDRHFLCDLCMTSGKFVVFREQWELLDHYGDSHHLCTECRAQQRISCFASADRLGLHRFQEHPNEVANDPNSWLPISIQLAPDTESRYRPRDTRDIYRVSGILSSSDGRLIAEDNRTTASRRPNPSEWTGEDFPVLTMPITCVQNSTSVTNTFPVSSDITSIVTDKLHTKSPAIAKTWLSRTSGINLSHQNTLTLDDFPSLPNNSQGNVNVPTNLSWVKSTRTQISFPNTSQGSASLPTASDFPTLSGSSSTSRDVSSNTTNWINSSSTGSDEVKLNECLKLERRSIPEQSDFPSLSSNFKGNRSELRHGGSSVVSQTNKKDAKLRISGQSKLSKDASIPKSIQRNNEKPIRSDGLLNKDLEDQCPDEIQQFSHIQLVDRFDGDNAQPTEVHSTQSREFNTLDFPNLVLTSSLGDFSNGATQNKNSSTGESEILKTSITSASKSLKSTKTEDQMTKLDPKLIEFILKNQNIDTLDAECFLYYNAVYSPLPDMDTRNQNLIHTVEMALFNHCNTKNAFAHFADLSRRYHHKQINATAYFEGLISLLNIPPAATDEVAPTWIAPMLTLLPDIGLQRALYRVIQGQGPPRLPSELQDFLIKRGKYKKKCKDSILPPPWWSKKILRLLQICNSCGQVCLRNEMKLHLANAHPT